MRRTWVRRGFAVLAAALALFVWSQSRHRLPRGPGERFPSSQAPASAAGVSLTDSTPAPTPGATEEPSHLGDDLNAPQSDIHADLRLIEGLLVHYRGATHGLNPVGDNADVTAALAGRNPLGFAFLPKNLPAINAQGELCDRWGTPFFFHALSGTQMEIRSAGPDRKLWTADDEVLTPGLSRPPL